MTNRSTSSTPFLAYKIAFLALAYASSGKLGLLLAIPPGYATAIFPPSGIALAALWIFGLRLWPGVLLGSFVMNVWVGYDTAGFVNEVSMVVAAAIAVGATFQALVGGYLLRRWIQLPTTLESGGDILRFVLLGAVASCVVSASVGVSTLYVAGRVVLDNALYTWWTWWVGDALGVLIVAPLVLIAIGEPRVVWRMRVNTVALPMLFATMVVVFAFIYVSYSEQYRIREEFNRQAQQIVAGVQHRFQEHLDALRYLRSFFSGTGHVNPDAFQMFVAHSLENYVGIQALEWVPRVDDEERATFERRQSAEQNKGFVIRERTVGGELMPAPRRNTYFPATYVEPYAGNEKVLGYDLASNAERRAALEWARDTGKLATSSGLRLVQEPQRAAVKAVIAIQPLYEANKPVDTVEERRAYLRGFVVEVLRINQVIADVRSQLSYDGLRVQIEDHNALLKDRVLYTDAENVSEINAAEFSLLVPISGVGNQWDIRVVASPQFVADSRSWQAWTVLAAGLMFTALLGAFLLMVTGHSARVELLVDRRTQELKRATEVIGANNALLAAIGSVQTDFIAATDSQTLFDRLLWEILELTQGEYALIGEVSSEDGNPPVINVLSINCTRWIFDQRQAYERDASRRIHLPLHERNLLSEVVRSGQMVSVSETINSPHSFPWPYAHGAVRNAICLPLLHATHVDGVLVIANRAAGFDAAFESFMRPMARTCANILGALRNERRRLAAEKELTESQRRLGEAQRIAHLGAWEWREGEALQIWSDEQYRTLGYTPRSIEPTYENFMRAVHLEDREAVRCARAIALSQDQPYRAEFRVVHPNGEVRYVLADGEVIRDDAGKVVGMMGVNLDITERKQAEEQTRIAKENAEKANRAKSEFLSSMSHELRTPLNSVLGYAQLMALDHSLNEKTQLAVKSIHDSGEHLLSLINDILDLSRIESDTLTLDLTDVALAEVISECVALIEPAARAKNLRFNAFCALGEDARVTLDRTRIKQVLLNLLSNAVKYNVSAGSVDLSCEWVNDQTVRISVSDTGMGLSASQQAALFQPFNRLGLERSNIEGTGIGLVICKRLVEMMHGTLEVKSVEGRGSTFSVSLPFRRVTTSRAAEPQSVSAARDLGVSHYSGTLLYVEDNTPNIELVSALVHTFWPQARLLTALTAEQGLDVARAERPDVILFDINLPNMDGYEALQLLRDDEILKHVPVIAVTANASSSDIERGRAAGFFAYVTKPLHVQTLVDTVNAAVARVTHRPPPSNKILIVDDDVTNREVARGLVQALGYTTDVVAGGAEALAAIEGHRYSAILMDCEMPQMNGYQTTQAIRQRETGQRRTPVLAMSAYATHENAQQRTEAGMDDAIAKPLSLEALRGALARWTYG